MAITVPPDSGRQLMFLLIMMALRSTAVLVAVLHPVAWTDEEIRFAVGGPGRPRDPGRSSGRSALGALDRQSWSRGSPRRRSAVALLLVLSSRGVYVAFGLAGRLGFGPMAAPPGRPIPPGASSRPRRPPRAGCGPGSALGIPAVWMAVCLLVLPLVVYVIVVPAVGLVEGNRHHRRAGRPATPARPCST